MKWLARQLLTLSLCAVVAQQAAAQDTPVIIHLWELGAPGFENRRNEPEQAQDYWVKNIHNPSVTVFVPPAGKANGTAVVICPGGGHRELVYNAEGVDPARYLNSLGITAFVLKYRLSRESNSPYSLDKTPREDALRAIRLVRSRSTQWNLDTGRIGMLGFSAGGEVVATVAYQNDQGSATAPDPVDRLNGRPNFQMLIYPGPLGMPETVGADAPPAFLLAANDDACCSEPIVRLLSAYRKAKVPVETHLYATSGHGFNMGLRSKLASVSTWPQRMGDWLKDYGYLAPVKKK